MRPASVNATKYARMRCPSLCGDQFEHEDDQQRRGHSETTRTPSRAASLIAVGGLERLKRPEWSIRRLAVLLLVVELIASLMQDEYPAWSPADDGLAHPVDRRLKSARWLHQLIVPVGATSEDAYTDASAESPAVDALEDDDEDDEELNASASNDYPEGENDNDESYDDNDDERQESRITERWIKQVAPYKNSSLFQFKS